MGDFERDTSVSAGADGVFECEIRPDWWVVAGPNGGYLAAILVRALAHDAALEGRPLRALTVHYLRAPKAGAAEVQVSSDRHGRSVSFRRARLVQDGRPCASALAVFATDRPGIELDRARPPEVPTPEELEPLAGHSSLPPFAHQFDYRRALGGPLFGGSEEALAGGWLRLHDERPLDAPAVVAFCDSWYPAIFAVSSGPLAVPTLELTVHLRDDLPKPADWVLGRFSTRVARHGFLEEEAELFSREGVLLAQSRQLALAG